MWKHSATANRLVERRASHGVIILLAPPWHIQLLGRLEARCGDIAVTRFRTQKAAGIFAFISYYSNRVHPREVLIEQYWPDASIESGRNSLKQELAALRRQLEIPGTPHGSVIIADRTTLRINPETVQVDALRFEILSRAAADIADPAMRARSLEEAAALYQGELLPGHYEEWVLMERRRLAGLYGQSLNRLADAWLEIGEPGRALNAALICAEIDPLEEADQARVIQLYLATQQPEAARAHYDAFVLRLREELECEPSDELKSLITGLPAARSSKRQKGLLVHRETTASQHKSLPPSRLPVPLTRFFGRERELAQIPETLFGAGWNDTGSLADDRFGARLLTLVGPGGVGKTRLALEVARRMASSLQGRSWFIQLADVQDPTSVPMAILEVMGVPKSTDSSPLTTLVSALSEQTALLVLDNFEQLTETGAALVSELLSRAPLLHCLVTSRCELGVQGERLLSVRPLSSPDGSAQLDGLLDFASVQLFLDRAQAVRPDFQVTPRNAATVAAVCERLDGIPLALELAAAWSSALTPSQILERLSQRFALLVSRHRDTPDRHRTLQAAIEGSFRLLSKAQQQLFLRLSVFRGGWSLESAEAVVELDSVEGAESTELPQMLAQLQERSLIHTEERGAELRFRMLETLREFAVEQSASRERSEMAKRHCAYFRKLARESSFKLIGVDQSIWYERLEHDHDNLRSALAWAIEHDINEALLLAADLWIFWEHRCFAAEGTRWLQNILNHPDAARPTEPRARALYALSQVMRARGEFGRAIELIEENLQIAYALNNRHAIAATLNGLAGLTKSNGDIERAAGLYTESLAVYMELGDRKGMAAVFNNQGLIAEHTGHFEEASEHYRAALAMNREIGNRLWEAQNLSNIGITELNRKRFAQARAAYEESLSIHREISNRHGICDVVIYIGELALREQNQQESRERMLESLQLARDLKDPARQASALGLGADILLTESDLPGAAARMEECLWLLREDGDRFSVSHVLHNVASLAFATNDVYAAARFWGAADRLYAIDRRWRPDDHIGDLHRRSAQDRGDAKFEEAWIDGEKLTQAAAVEQALRFTKRHAIR